MWFKLIRTMALQLCVRIDDYDVAYKVAELYVHDKIRESTEDATVYHRDRLLLHQMRLWFSPGRDHWPCGCVAVRTIHDIHRHHHHKYSLSTYNNTLKYLLEYVHGDGMSIRSSYWRTSAASWGVTNLDKGKLSLCDKLADVNHIPINILKSLTR